MKTCRKCGEEKPIDQFYRQKTSSDGHGSYCKVCNKAEAKKYVKREPERAAANFRKGKLKYRYGLTVEQFDRMVDDQSGRCAICSREIELAVDHDHDTGKVRGLLCTACNLRLGYGPLRFFISGLVREAEEYLDRCSQPPE